MFREYSHYDALGLVELIRRRVDPECVAAAEQVAALCVQLGHKVEPAQLDISDAQIESIWRTVGGAYLCDALSAKEQALGRAVVEENVEPITWQWAQEGKVTTSAMLAAATRAMHSVGRRLGAFFQRYDVMLSPTLANPPLPLGAVDMQSTDLDDYCDRQLFGQLPFTPVYNIAGCPAMSVPLGWSEAGLPIGVQFGAAFGNEALLYRLAGQLEQAAPWEHKRPVATGR